MKPEPPTGRDLTDPACVGVLAGMATAVVLELRDALPGTFADVDPFVYAIMVPGLFAAGGAAVSVALVMLREWFRRRSDRRKRP